MTTFMNRKLPQYFLGKYQLLGTVTFSVLFAVVFLNIYIPFSDTAWFGLGDSVTFLLTLIFASVAILILILSRVMMYRSKNYFDLTFLTYTIWALLEIASIAGIYTWITIEYITPFESPWATFRRSFLYSLAALGLPYIISGMYFAIIDKNNTIRLLNYDNVVTDEPHRPETDKKRITLFDNSGALKLSLNLSSLYYIESDDNYIKVWYTDSRGQLQKYMLRCRLKTVEDSFKDSGLVRCNRKYIVNLEKVSMLRKENEGFILDLCNKEIPPLPVTKTYIDTILGYFTEQQPLMEPME